MNKKKSINFDYLSKPTWNQSMVQQLTSDGNFLNLSRKASPIGLIAKTIWS